ncbi:thiamine phosphate synthase [Sulfurimonas sp.]|jgi:thiamine-phosphate pyrophosphorylase|uniref:thiamine phosphate synthase n=1 Tax=Sulfurimonas sp. TaxID=2022749 RepID=UPI002A362303|nr:thiamine phosphate synthase [Sulfurimonas sp.]MDY0123271.1 thiamine phosphate synthase [Sulfurimonas sp.]
MQKYLITSEEFYGTTPELFRSKLDAQIQKHKPSYALYRDKANPNYKELAAVFADVCRGYKGLKCFLHQDAELANKLGVSGVHLTSAQFEEIQEAKRMGLFVIISTHTQEELLRAQKLGADAVTYSPIFASPNKGEPKGVEELKRILDISYIKVFALGGIVTQEQVEMIEESKAYGFASIRYFY